MTIEEAMRFVYKAFPNATIDECDGQLIIYTRCKVEEDGDALVVVPCDGGK